MKLNKVPPIFALFILTVLSACGNAAPPEFSTDKLSDNLTVKSETKTPNPKLSQNAKLKISNLKDAPELNAILDQAELSATEEGRRILQTARLMRENQVIIIGSCWDYINGVFKQAGITGRNIITPYAQHQAGPYADPSEIQPGDWLYFINHSYGNVEHSGIFVAWTDQASLEALVLSYPGGNRVAPSRYSTYQLTSVYNIMRGKPGSAEGLAAVQSTPSPAPESNP